MSQTTTPGGPPAAPVGPRPPAIAPPPMSPPPSQPLGSGATPGVGPAPSPTPGRGEGRGRISRLVERAEAALAGSPGQLRIAATVAILAALAVGLGSAQALSVRSRALADAKTSTSHLVLLQQARTALVQADADATNSALSSYVLTANGQPALEPAGQRAQYVAAISTASRDLAQAANGVDGSEVAALSLANDALSQYTGTIESARTYTRLGNPTGAYYLKAASGQLRSSVLPQLAALAQDDEVRVAADFDRAVNARLWLIVLGALGLLGLLGVQLRLARRTHRIINLPLAVGSLGLALLLATSVVVMWAAQNHAADVRAGAYDRTVALAQARVSAFDARSQESLYVISQGSGDAYNAAYTASMAQALAVLPADQKAAATALKGFDSQHQKIQAAGEASDWATAFRLATITGDGSGKAYFGSFESLSDTALGQAAAAATRGLGDSGDALVPLAALMVLAGLIGAGCAWWGVSLRLDEYR